MIAGIPFFKNQILGVPSINYGIDYWIGFIIAKMNIVFMAK
jgi:hypothetical protein